MERDHDTLYAANPEVVLREEDGENGLLFNPDTDQIVVVNSTGLFVWKSLASSRPLAAVAAALQESFPGAQPAEAAADVEEFVAMLAQNGFIQVVERPCGNVI